MSAQQTHEIDQLHRLLSRIKAVMWSADTWRELPVLLQQDIEAALLPAQQPPAEHTWTDERYEDQQPLGSGGEDGTD